MPEGFNYAIRYAKNIERKLLCDMLARLSAFAPLNEYRYLGFGSIWFVDFRLFHTRLGIRSMISMEDTIPIDRCTWNRPFNCIEVVEGNSGELLPNLSHDQRTVAWLDYTDALTVGVLDDVDTLTSSMLSGGAILVTVRCKPSGISRETIGRVEYMRASFGAFVPMALADEDVADAPGICSAYRDILCACANEAARRKTDATGVARNVRQFALFFYKDGMPMCTWGAVIVDGADNALFDLCNFSNFEFSREGRAPFRILPPMLTGKEKRALDQALPLDDQARLDGIPLTPAAVAEYKKMYRHYPSFAETFGA